MSPGSPADSSSIFEANDTLLNSLPAEKTTLEWLEMPIDSSNNSSASLFGLSNLLHSLIREAEEELHALASESDCDLTSEDAPIARRRGSHRPSASPQPSDLAAVQDFLYQCRSYIQLFKTQMLSCLPDTPAALKQAHTGHDASSAESAQAEASKLVTTLQHVHDLLCLLAHTTTSNISEAASTMRDSLPSPSMDSLRASSEAFLARLPEPPSIPLDKLRAAFAERSGTISSAMSSVGMQFSASQRLTELANNISSSHTMELVGQAGEAVSEEAHKLKDKVVEETEKLGHLIGEEAEKFKKALQEGANRLLHYDDLPNLWKNNEYILSGYRFIPIERTLLAEGFRPSLTTLFRLVRIIDVALQMAQRDHQHLHSPLWRSVSHLPHVCFTSSSTTVAKRTSLRPNRQSQLSHLRSGMHGLLFRLASYGWLRDLQRL